MPSMFIKRTIGAFAIHPGRTARAFINLPTYISNYRTFKQLSHSGCMPFEIGAKFPQLLDRNQKGGTAKGHYFHQDLLVASRIFLNKPIHHVDVGSRVDGFVAHVASFREIEVFDIREIDAEVRNIKFTQLDIMAPLAVEYQNYCMSLSCLHALEHFGLGRYGDKVDPDGYLTGLDNMVAMVKRGGTFYLSVPVGPQRIEFDAHRVFSVAYIDELFKARGLQIEQFSFVDDSGNLHENVPLTSRDMEQSFGCNYGCGIFEATKI